MTEPDLLDPASERTLVAALGYLDDVQPDDESFWPRIVGELRLVLDALREGDPARAQAAIRGLDRGLTHRAIPIGSRSKEPMPAEVRELRTAVRLRLGDRSSTERDGGSAAPAASERPRKEGR